MNKRIQELAEQATSIVDMVGPQGYTSSYANFDREKFAELIIRECVAQIENLSPGYEDYRNQIEDAFRRDCSGQIKQHFGVEE